jgi:hypothetical protein
MKKSEYCTLRFRFRRIFLFSPSPTILSFHGESHIATFCSFGVVISEEGLYSCMLEIVIMTEVTVVEISEFI